MEQDRSLPEWRERVVDRLIRQSREELEGPVRERVAPDESVRPVFELIHMARAFEYFLGRAAAGHAMTAQQARFAWLIATSPWGVNLAELEVCLGLSQPAVSRMIGRMRDRGLVTTALNIQDTRNRTAELTELGTAQWERVRDDLATATESLRAVLGESQAPTFLDDAKRVARLDTRHAWIHELRNPFGFLS